MQRITSACAYCIIINLIMPAYAYRPAVQYTVQYSMQRITSACAICTLNIRIIAGMGIIFKAGMHTSILIIIAMPVCTPAHRHNYRLRKLVRTSHFPNFSITLCSVGSRRIETGRRDVASQIYELCSRQPLVF